MARATIYDRDRINNRIRVRQLHFRSIVRNRHLSTGSDASNATSGTTLSPRKRVLRGNQQNNIFRQSKLYAHVHISVQMKYTTEYVEKLFFMFLIYQVKSLDGMWDFLVSPSADPLKGYRESWFADNLSKVTLHTCILYYFVNRLFEINCKFTIMHEFHSSRQAN